jgi:signal transduction histidine kinase
MANLLNNAMKFTRPGGKIVLRGEFLDEEVRVSVTDTGIGVASPDQERIFEKFQQVGDTLTDKPRGTGLGLAICRDIVEHHQGRLWIDSTPGMGSTFSVALPPAADAVVVELAQAA